MWCNLESLVSAHTHHDTCHKIETIHLLLTRAPTENFRGDITNYPFHIYEKFIKHLLVYHNHMRLQYFRTWQKHEHKITFQSYMDLFPLPMPACTKLSITFLADALTFGNRWRCTLALLAMKIKIRRMCSAPELQHDDKKIFANS